MQEANAVLLAHAFREGSRVEEYVLRMTVRTEETRLIRRAFTPSSRWPKPCSALAVHPTARLYVSDDHGLCVEDVSVGGGVGASECRRGNLVRDAARCNWGGS